MRKQNKSERAQILFPGTVSIQPPQSIHVRVTFGSDYSCESFWVSLSAFHAWIVQHLPILFKILQALPNWVLIIARQQFSSLAIDFQADLSQNCNLDTQEHSLSSLKATPVQIWPFVLGYYLAESLIIFQCLVKAD